MKDTRIKCCYCGVRTWSVDYRGFMSDHDRPDGRRCVRASKHGKAERDYDLVTLEALS